jgi:hypothetical protein
MTETTSPRYVAMPQAPFSYSFSQWGEAHPTLQVVEVDNSPVDTGLLTASGVKLYRVPETVPIGFHAKRK